MLLGIDTGGTFTDFVLVDGRDLKIHKVLSTPHAPDQAILQGIRDLGLEGEGLRIVHGSTVATNAVLEGKGVRTVFITNRGFGDMLTIGRQARRALYDLQPPPQIVPVPSDLCLETGGRMSADGAVLDPLTDDDLAELRARVEALAPKSVAINLLFSFVDAAAEKAIARGMPDGVFVSRSSEILPEYKEYERGITTWLNAYVGPLVEGYLKRLQAGIETESMSVMQSAGGTIAASQAGRHAVQMLLSGPAGGLMGALHIGRLVGRERLLTFDMGGTSTDVALIDGRVPLTSEGRIGPFPVCIPMVDMHTIGAGGGSIARVDAAGMLCVGPESAGADPGPACYGRGGDRATVTDANLVAGRLHPEEFLGGKMGLDTDAARHVVGGIATQLGCALEDAALGIIGLANEHMARALRVISVQRGIDPRQFTLVSFGGAGGLHVCALAEALDMRSAMVPVHAGVLSALGMLAAPRSRQFSHTFTGLLRKIAEGRIKAELQRVADKGRCALQEEGVQGEQMRAELSVDLRYRGQSFTLTVPWVGAGASEAAFHRLHEECYGHCLDLPVDLVNVRAVLYGDMPGPSLKMALPRRRTKPGRHAGLPVYGRDALGLGTAISGPALIVETVATTFVQTGWICRVAEYGNLLLTKESV
ncbi:MAG: hydantoinase/oxoprolinase family protein [Pseudomonadota bacterium]